MHEKSGRPALISFPFPGLFLVALALVLAVWGCQPAGDQPGGEKTRPPARFGESVKDAVAEALAPLENPVNIYLFSGGQGETDDRETRDLLELIAGASPKVSFSAFSLGEDSQAKEFFSNLGVSHGPAIRIQGEGRQPLFYLGLPERKELAPFLEGIALASGAPADLPAPVEDFLINLQEEVLIRIFTTPDCGYCPIPVNLAYSFASRSAKITSLVFGSHQFPKESQAFGVVTVPKIWVNDKVFVDGTAPSREMMAMTLVGMIRQALDESVPPGKFRVRIAN